MSVSYRIKALTYHQLKNKYFRRCGKVRKETYVTSDYGNPNLMLLTFDSAFASTATAAKGFNLTISSVGEGKCVS